MPRGVIGNTPDSGSGKSRFDPWRGNVGGLAGEATKAPHADERLRRGVFSLSDGQEHWGVAELAKHRTVNPRIAGSNPAAPADRMERRGAREAQGSGLLNRDAESVRGFESHPLRCTTGRVSERLKEHDWKSCGVNSPRGFESHPVRSG
jgi:hypothetical protein